MPIYVYQNDKGEIKECVYPIGKAPNVIPAKGGDWRRVITVPQISAGVHAAVHQYPYVSRSLPKRLEGAPHDEKGRTIITSQRHEREIARRHGYVRD